MGKYALLPGGYRPPHSGHYNSAKWMAENLDVDKVIVRIGAKERDGITKEMSLELWELYQLSDPDPSANKIEISLSKSPSPVKDVYDFVELEAPEGSTVYLGMGEKDAQDKRYANIAKFAEPRGISFETALIPPQSGGISGTQMRQFILDGNKEEFQKYLPDHLTQELKDDAWEIVAGVVTEVTMLSEMFYGELDIPKFSSKKDSTQQLVKTLNEITLSVDNAVEVDGNEFNGFFKVGDINYEYDINKIPSPYQDGKILYNIQFHPKDNPTSEPLSGKENYIKILSTMYKVILNFIENVNPDYVGLASLDGFKNYHQVYANLTDNKFNNIPGYSRKDVAFPFEVGDTTGKMVILKKKENQTLNEVTFIEALRNPEAKTLYAFDLDDTLISTDSHIHITDLTGETKSLTPFEYATYTPDENDKLDFSDFYGLKNPKALPQMFGLFEKILNKTSHLENADTIIVTARPPEAISDIKEFLNSHGLDKINIYAVGSSDPLAKVEVILDYIENGYKNIRFYDDSPKNVKAVQTLDDSTDAHVEAKLISLGQMVQEMTGGATMNQGEMKKHRNKLKKLQKVLDNQGNQMIPYPTDLPNTVFGVDMDEQKLFSKDWWVKAFQEVLQEGGAAGHMAHPFDLPQVKSGKDLVKNFVDTAKSLKNKPGSVKIDGVNASVRFNGEEFVLDRGSKKELDIKGITKDDLIDRFGEGHGMVKAGGEVLDILNKAIPSIKPELDAIGMSEDSNLMFNMEYVGGKTNVQDYDKNFLAIHSVMKIETKEVQGKRKMLTKRVTSEVNVDSKILDSLISKLNQTAKDEGFEVYGDVPTQMKSMPNFNSALSKQYTVVDGDEKITKSLKQWVEEIDSIPKDQFVTINGKKIGAVSKAVYMYVLDQDDVSLIDDKEIAIKGAMTYLATEKLGDEILKVLDSPMGSVEEHEGVVIRDANIYNKPYKITGKFILGGMATSFRN